MSDGVKIFHSDDQIFLIILKTGHRHCMLCYNYNPLAKIYTFVLCLCSYKRDSLVPMKSRLLHVCSCKNMATCMLTVQG